MMVSTTNQISGFKTVRHFGSCARHHSALAQGRRQFCWRLAVYVWRPDRRYVELAETARQEAFDHMCAHAEQGGANAVIGMRYDANDIMDGITEVLAYGTAVWVEPLGA